MIRVFELPSSLRTGGFLHGGGQPFEFMQLDWFEAEPPAGLGITIPTPGTPEWRAMITEFIRPKRYFQPGRAYLILHPEHTFTIDYDWTK